MIRSKLVKTLIGAGIFAAGCLFQGNCAGLARVNPCGTILSSNFCDPLVFEQLFGNPFESDFDADPTCVIPFACQAGGQ